MVHELLAKARGDEVVSGGGAIGAAGVDDFLHEAAFLVDEGGEVGDSFLLGGVVGGEVFEFVEVVIGGLETALVAGEEGFVGGDDEAAFAAFDVGEIVGEFGDGGEDAAGVFDGGGGGGEALDAGVGDDADDGEEEEGDGEAAVDAGFDGGMGGGEGGAGHERGRVRMPEARRRKLMMVWMAMGIMAVGR